MKFPKVVFIYTLQDSIKRKLIIHLKQHFSYFIIWLVLKKEGKRGLPQATHSFPVQLASPYVLFAASSSNSALRTV